MATKMRRPGVYQIRNTLDGTVYIGSTGRCIEERWTNHLRDLAMRRHHNEHLQRAWDKYGPTAFSFTILEETGAHLEREQSHLDQCRMLGIRTYNQSPITRNAQMGMVRPLEHCRKISEAKRGKPIGPFSVETRKRMSLAWAGVPRGPMKEEQKRRISQAMAGRPLTKTHVAAMARPHPSFVNAITGEIIPAGRNLSAMAHAYGLDSGNMSRVMRGLRSHYKGWQLPCGGAS